MPSLAANASCWRRKCCRCTRSFISGSATAASIFIFPAVSLGLRAQAFATSAFADFRRAAAKMAIFSPSCKSSAAPAKDNVFVTPPAPAYESQSAARGHRRHNLKGTGKNGRGAEMLGEHVRHTQDVSGHKTNNTCGRNTSCGCSHLLTAPYKLF